MKHALAGILIMTAAALPAKSAEVDTVVIGDLTLSFDPDIWRFQTKGGRMSLEQTDDHHDDLGIGISIQGGDPQSCSQQAMETLSSPTELHGTTVETYTLKREGFDLHVAELQLGCRNWTGSPVYACTSYRGSIYTFVADPGGCDTPPRYHEPVLDVLSGLRKS